MRVVVTGGGTGGHIFPALAIATELIAEGDELLYLGKTHSMESELAPKHSLAFEGIPFFGMPRKPGLELLKWFAALFRAIRQAKDHLRAFKPDVVIGTGGYVSAPVLMAAHQLKIPYVLHEPDAMPGLANRFLSKNAALITAAFPASAKHFKLRPGDRRFYHTGNPIRQGVGEIDKAAALQALGLNWDPEIPVLLVFGGSQGARTLNTALVEALPDLLGPQHIHVLHLSGKKLYDETREQLSQTSLAEHPSYWLRAFSEEMPLLLSAADLAVCRSGSLSLSELYAAGLPTILIPYPFAAANHQQKNAETSVEAGASWMILDADLNGETLLTAVRGMFADQTAWQRMADSARKLAKPTATEVIATLVHQAAGKTSAQ